MALSQQNLNFKKMNNYNSTIKRKPCKCGCGKFPKIGLNGYASVKCMPEDMAALPKYRKSNLRNRNRVNLTNLSSKVWKAQKEVNVVKSPENGLIGKLNSELMKLADILFSRYIKKRDADSRGNVNCPCCGGSFNLKEKNQSGEYMVQCLHFVKRSVISLRWSEVNCHAGCSRCNSDMFNNPEGLAYRRFRGFLVDAVGEDKVQEMEDEKNKIGKVSSSLLNEIIKKYS